MIVKKKVPKKKTPVKKGSRRTAIQTPDFNAEIPVKTVKAEDTVRSTVGAGEIKKMMNATTWRVMKQIYPGIENMKDARLNSDEFAYIVLLFVMLGVSEEGTRKGLRIRRHEFNSDIPLCREHG